MKNARVIFKNGVAFSPEFDDIYYNGDDAIGQSKHVFLSAIDEIWSKKSEINILEAGFGAGINFLCAFNKFKNSGKFLNFVSIEANPIAKEDLAKIYANFNELSSVSSELLSAYPPLIRGFHRLNLAPNVTLTLCFGDVREVLDELSFSADAVFMDGFAPAKNEAMWSEEVCAKIANLCVFGARICTYSASGSLKRALQNSGFEVNLQKGYGKKREMTRAKFIGRRCVEREIWFSGFDPARAPSPKTALIIGGGVAGCVCAFKLRERGLDVTIAEKRGDIALNGSGNHCGILMPLITKPAVNLGRMHMNAFLQAARFYRRHLSREEVEFCGAKDYAYEQKTLERFYEWREFDADNGVFELNFDDRPYVSAFVFEGAKARPRKMCKAASAGVKTLLNREFTGFETLEGGAVRAYFKDGESMVADVLVLALGSESMEFFASYDIQLSSVRGQVTHIAPAVPAATPFSAKGYVCPPADGVQVIGATYDRNLFLDEARASDDAKNLADVAEFLDGEFCSVLPEGSQETDATDERDFTRCALKNLTNEKEDSVKTTASAGDESGANAQKSSNINTVESSAEPLNLINLNERTHRLDALNSPNLKKESKNLCALNLDLISQNERANLQNFAEDKNANDFSGAIKAINFTQIKSSDDSCDTLKAQNSANAASKIPQNIQVIGAKVGYRSYSGDRFPLIGRLYDEDFYCEAYKSLLWTKNKPNLPPKYAPNVYVSAAHGSRGLCTAVLGAELICDLVFDRPLCIEKSLFNDLHLARFLIRKLKKGLK